MRRYRIRVGKTHFADPHYITKLGFSPNCSSIMVNKKPCSWKKRATAEKHLGEVKEYFSSAEIEGYDTDD